MKNTITKLHPFPYSHFNYFETYLEEMGKSGLRLADTKQFTCKFERCEPTFEVYRIELANKSDGGLNSSIIQEYRDNGFELVSFWNSYYFFRGTTDFNRKETAGCKTHYLKMASNHVKTSIFSLVMYIILLIMLFSLGDGALLKTPVLTLVHKDNILIPFTIGYIIIAFLGIIEMVYYIRLKRYAKKNNCINHDRPWKLHRCLSMINYICSLAILASIIVLPLFNYGLTSEYIGYDSDMLNSVPIITSSDISAYSISQPIYKHNKNFLGEYYSNESNIIHWNEDGPNDASGTPCYLSTSYYSLKNQFLSDSVLKELIRKENLGNTAVPQDGYACFDKVYKSAYTNGFILFVQKNNDVWYINYWGKLNSDDMLKLLEEKIS